MKDQYIADIGDYGKYALLKAFSDAGVKVGINWYYTDNDPSNDGKHVSYLERADLRDLCPAVFDVLKDVYKTNRTIEAFERTNVLPNAVYYRGRMDFDGTRIEKTQQRRDWFERGKKCLSGTELVFLDPDNGLYTSKRRNQRILPKYVLPEEVEELYAHHNVVYYCHKGRRTVDQWEAYKASMFIRIPEAIPIVLTYHKGTQRSYVFLIHPEDATGYRGILDSFMMKWEGVFTEEGISRMRRRK